MTEQAAFDALALTTQEDTFLPEHAKLYLTLLQKLGPLCYNADNETAEQFAKRARPPVEKMLTEMGKKSTYLMVDVRILWFREQFPFGVIFSFLWKYEPDKLLIKRTLFKKNEVDPGEWKEEKCYGEATAASIIFTGRGQVGFGMKYENAAEFPDYREKADTGAVGRALGHLGYGTRNAGLIEGVPVDSPVAVQETSGTTSVAPPPRPVIKKNNEEKKAAAPIPIHRTSEQQRATAPIQPSAQVTTQTNLAPAPKIEPKVPLILTKDIEEEPPTPVGSASSQLLALMTKLPEEEQARIVQFCHVYGFPSLIEEWTQEQYTAGYANAERWLRPCADAPITQEQVTQLMGYNTLCGMTELKKFATRLCGDMPASDLNITRAGYLIKMLDSHNMVYELAMQIDITGNKIFAHAHQTYGVTSPLELIGTDHWHGYSEWLAQQEEEPTHEFKERYGQDYIDWLNSF